MGSKDLKAMKQQLRRMLDASGMTPVSVRAIGNCLMARAHLLRSFRVGPHEHVRAVEWTPALPERLALFRSAPDRHELIAVVDCCIVHGVAAEPENRSPLAMLAGK